MRIETVTSVQNPKIKELIAFGEKSRLRRERGIFIVEGRRELGHCLNAGFLPFCVFVCGEILGEEGLEEVVGSAIAAHPPCKIVQVSYNVYEKMAYRGSTEGVIAEILDRPRGLEQLRLRANPLVVVLEAVEKPGNLGAVLRSADAADADAVIICDPLTDLYNPNLIRSSIGAVFTRQIAVADSETTIKWLKDMGISILTAQLQDSDWYYDTDMRHGTAIVMGTEATGLTDIWREAADAHIKIPMLGELDSLNVSVSAAILLFEAVRQRKSGK
ncbi:MAG: RNA methyltransferase [Bacteroidales bacterium]|nr:RNA methyltransferase [Bacteroidales bacterium]